MAQLHPHYLVDEDGKCTQIVLDVGEFQKLMDAAGLTEEKSPQAMSIESDAQLEWTREQAADARRRLQSFEADWNAPGMELYDAL